MPTVLVMCSKCKENLEPDILHLIRMESPQCPNCDKSLTIPWATDAKLIMDSRARVRSYDTTDANLLGNSGP